MIDLLSMRSDQWIPGENLRGERSSTHVLFAETLENAERAASAASSNLRAAADFGPAPAIILVRSQRAEAGEL